ncbi:cysteine desulfuration protein SufE [Cyanobacterium sp. HL-69]|uniref:SufE family protein n=1 Tax=unclassified Cyanobacterium TaxID=2629879 RepID=UPI0008525427|nr:SufE family protein [Cyanobacterium sp. IPPAS B-1200]AUC60201.1 cysteine desulfuration protein SufE [Cyanobacterium sp. HL-69]OEJ79696.1 cysteine desufuration protein SufE [Cyanobacterium sp. IPPAS B-1200]
MTSNSTTRPEKLDKIVQKFKRRENPKQKYEQLLWYAKKLETLPETAKTSENKVSGCVSQVYIISNIEDGQIFYQGDSDAQLVKGLVAFLIDSLNGLTPQEIVTIEPDFIEETGLQASLTPSRANGFLNIFKKMQQLALVSMA